MGWLQVLCNVYRRACYLPASKSRKPWLCLEDSCLCSGLPVSNTCPARGKSSVGLRLVPEIPCSKSRLTLVFLSCLQAQGLAPVPALTVFDGLQQSPAQVAWWSWLSLPSGVSGRRTQQGFWPQLGAHCHWAHRHLRF